MQDVGDGEVAYGNQKSKRNKSCPARDYVVRMFDPANLIFPYNNSSILFYSLNSTMNFIIIYQSKFKGTNCFNYKLA